MPINSTLLLPACDAPCDPCGCSCAITGSLMLGGELSCLLTADFSSDFCDNDYEPEQIKFRLTELPSNVVREGDSTDMPFSIYGREEYSYELEMWYDLDGGEAPCSGLPTEAEPHTVEVEVLAECCGDSCSIDAYATQSTVQVAGFEAALMYNTPGYAHENGGTFCAWEPTEILQRKWIGWDALNHSIVSTELKTISPEGCVTGVTENKIVDLGTVTYTEQQFIQSDSNPIGSKPSWSYTSPAGLVTLVYRVWSVFGNWVWNAAGTAPELVGNANTWTMAILLESVTTGTRYEEDGTLDSSYGGNHIGLSLASPRAVVGWFTTATLPDGVAKPCHSNAGQLHWDPRASGGQGSFLYPTGSAITYNDTGGCNADWYNHDQSPWDSGTEFSDDMVPSAQWLVSL